MVALRQRCLRILLSKQPVIARSRRGIKLRGRLIPQMLLTCY